MERKNIELTNKMKEISEFFKDLGNVYFVGGCIRDILIGDEPKDYDMITDKIPDEIEAYMKSKGKRVFGVGKRFGTLCCKVGENNELVEVTTFRSECYNDGTRKPTVAFTTRIEKDLMRRDFTINAIAADLDGKIIDPLGCRKDIENKILKAVGVSKHRFKEDPLRILRGIRFAAKYELEVEANTWKRLESCRWELYRISKERIIDEMNKMFLLDVDGVDTSLLYLWELKTLQIICPSMQSQWNFDQRNPNHDFELWQHTINTVTAIKKDEELKDNLPCLWSAFLHDIGKPFTQTEHKSGTYCNYINHELLGADLANDFCIKYKFSNSDRSFIVSTIKEHILDDNWLKVFDNRGKKDE